MYAQMYFRLVDALLRGISQVVFVSNPLSGLLIIIGIFLADYMVGIGTLACTLSALLSALYFKQNTDSIQDGLTQFNGVLVGSVIFSLYPGDKDIRMWIVTLAGGVVSVPIQVALTGLLSGVKAEFKPIKEDQGLKAFGIPGFTLPFNLTACLVLSLLQQSTQAQDGVAATANSTSAIIQYDQVFIGAIKSMGQVYAVDTLTGSILMYAGVALYSPLLAVIQFFGAVLGSIIAGQINAAYLPGVYGGIWGYCSVLTAGAVGGYFAVLTPKSLPLVMLAVGTTVSLQSTLQPFLQVGRLPVFTFPFVLTSWFFLLVNTENGILYRNENPTIPEINEKVWLQSLKMTPSNNCIDNGKLETEDICNLEKLHKRSHKELPPLLDRKL